MGKVRWDARSEDQFIQNYKILQRVFEKRGIDKVCSLNLHCPVLDPNPHATVQHVDVTKLIRAKYQDNLEMMQWMKNFFDHNCAESEYDPVERRTKGKGTLVVRNGNSTLKQNRRRGNRAKVQWMLRSKILQHCETSMFDSFAVFCVVRAAIQRMPTFAFLQVPTPMQSGYLLLMAVRKLHQQASLLADLRLVESSAQTRVAAQPAAPLLPPRRVQLGHPPQRLPLHRAPAVEAHPWQLLGAAKTATPLRPVAAPLPGKWAS